MRTHRVEPGDCISSIAYAYGFFPETLWDHPANEGLRKKRKDPNVLVPGDEVAIPDLRRRVVEVATGKTHRFVRRGVPEKLRLLLKDQKGRPRRNLGYVLEIDGVRVSGTTDGSGRLEQPIPPAARSARLRIDEDEEYELALGGLTPAVELSVEPGADPTRVEGVEQRLRNLGYLGDEEEQDEVWAGEELEPGELPHRLRHALEAFQYDRELEMTGELDDPTRAALEEAHPA